MFCARDCSFRVWLMIFLATFVSQTPKRTLDMLLLHFSITSSKKKVLVRLFPLMQHFTRLFIWLVGCFGLNGPLRQYFSLYRVVSQREGKKRKMIDERKKIQETREKMSIQSQLAPIASTVSPCPTIIRISRMPRH